MANTFFTLKYILKHYGLIIFCHALEKYTYFDMLTNILRHKSLNIILKLQAAMEGTSHPAPPTGGFRKTGNGEQYAFKKVNIEERVIVIYMC